MPPNTCSTNFKKRLDMLLVEYRNLNREDLESPTNPVLDVKLKDIVKQAERCAVYKESQNCKDEHPEHDAAGTTLWNLTTTLSRNSSDADYTEGSMNSRILHVRIFAYYLLDIAQSSESTRYENILRVFKVAIKIGRICLDKRDLHWAGKIMERAAIYQGKIAKYLDQNISAEDKESIKIQLCEYFTLRIALASRQSNHKMAELMFGQATDISKDLSNSRAFTNLATALFDIGNDLLSQDSFIQAINWLERSFNLLTKEDPTHFSNNDDDFALTVMQSLAKACIKTGTLENLKKAKNIIDMMHQEWPTRTTVQLLRLDLVAAESPDDTTGYCEVIMRMITVTQLSEITFKSILGRINVLVAKKASILGCKCLDTLISKRLLQLEKDDWLEQAFVTRLWITIQDSHACQEESIVESLKTLLDLIVKQLSNTLSAKATHAAQVLLWKVSEVFFTQKNWRLSYSWCKLALHMVFDKSGELNDAKIARRIIICAIEMKEYGIAAETFNDMKTSSREAPLSRFLMFKVALRNLDDDLALACLLSICENPASDRFIIYACALDAQYVGNQKLALKSLETILEQVELYSVEICHIPCLFRSTIRLRMADIEANSNSISGVESLCKLYEQVLKNAEKSRQKSRNSGKRDYLFEVKELNWLSRNAYNLGLRGIAEWPPDLTLRILTTCGKIMELYPEDIDCVVYVEISHRRLLCDYLCASLCIEMARIEEGIEKQLQRYLIAKNFIRSFRKELPERMAQLAEKDKQDLQKKQTSLITYDFEAATKLKEIDTLHEIVDESINFANDTISQLNIMSDIVLCSGFPGEIVLAVLQKLVGAMINAKNYENAKLARWIRYLVQLAMVKDSTVAETFLLQAVELVRNSKGRGSYPQEEIQWLVATAWNKSIDFNCASNETNGLRFGKHIRIKQWKMLNPVLDNYVGKMMRCWSLSMDTGS
ncbi:meiosis protein SPO22/ZIP4 like-domain-containing protein [Geopyxis carbonaria]|nr:meiosis protein SPO22/ZIP4 like-domain-containing protein [Geopyxis carbonaria]